VDEIGKMLPVVFRKQIRRAEPHLLEILLPLWPRIVGKAMAQHSQPTFFASSVLTLATDSTTWSTQLKHLSEEIRLEINGFLGQPIVKKLRIKTVSQPGLFSPQRASRGSALPAPPRAKQAMDTDSIADPEIASALASSYAKYFNRAGS
jgi:predicted nucleic acid-binding Zn ribbon protein